SAMTTFGVRFGLIFSLLRSSLLRSMRAFARQVRRGRFRCGLRVQLLPELHRGSLHHEASSTRLAKNLRRLASKATEFPGCGETAETTIARGVPSKRARSLPLPSISCQRLRFQDGAREY